MERAGRGARDDSSRSRLGAGGCSRIAGGTGGSGEVTGSGAGEVAGRATGGGGGVSRTTSGPAFGIGGSRQCGSATTSQCSTSDAPNAKPSVRSDAESG